MTPDRIRGAFPGGPHRDPSSVVPLARAPRIERVSDVEDRISKRRVERVRRRRAWRIGLALAVAVGLGAIIGAGIGIRSHTTQELLTAEQERSRQRDLDISEEVNRTLLELWKMEDVEALRNKGLTR